MAIQSIQHAFHLAMGHLSAGRFSEAETVFEEIIHREPGNADALHMLGIVHRRSGRNTSAIELIRRAIAVNPGCADAHYNLANSLRDAGEFDEAMLAYRRSISLKENVPQSYHNLGCVLRDRGMPDDAASAFEEEARSIAIARQAAAPTPDLARRWYESGNQLREQRRFAEAVIAYQQAIAIDPVLADAHSNLGNALVEQNLPDAAVTAYQQAIGIDPSHAQAYYNLGKLFYDRGNLDAAIAASRKAVSLRPGYAVAYRSLANSLFEAGHIDEAIATYRQAISDDPASNAQTDSDLIYTLHFHPESTPQSLAEHTRRWNQQYAQPFAEINRARPNHADRDRRLRIGYVSPDFRRHVVANNLVPLFCNHDAEQFEIHCYSDVRRPDEMTRWFEQRADVWRDTSEISDARLGALIREDRVDILVDLALHTRENRLLTFARKPALVQISFAGYPGSTGVSAIDYRLSDPYLDPPGATGSVLDETVIRLADSFWCYDPQDCGDLAVGPLPAMNSRIFTFGCLNNFCKINSAMLDLWAKVMASVPGSRLLLLAKQGNHRRELIDYLSNRGIAPQRIEFIPYLPRREYLQQYHRIDLGLDTFPYNGHTTSLDSFWMGVPVVTLVGEIPVSRAGWCQLANLNLPELAGQTAEQFVEIAIRLARDSIKLAELRAGLRSRMERSPLMDGGKFARSIGDAYRQAWDRYCRAD
jgi:protein O-GlcNAc transferase